LKSLCFGFASLTFRSRRLPPHDGVGIDPSPSVKRSDSRTPAPLQVSHQVTPKASYATPQQHSPKRGSASFVSDVAYGCGLGRCHDDATSKHSAPKCHSGHSPSRPDRRRLEWPLKSSVWSSLGSAVELASRFSFRMSSKTDLAMKKAERRGSM
jgi:hypothetical protein